MSSDNSKSPPLTAESAGTAPPEWTRREMKGIPASMGALWTRRGDDGAWCYGVQLDESHHNAQGFVHGGVLMSFMDHGLSLRVWEASGRAHCVTIHLDNHFLAPVRGPAFVELEATILRQGRKMMFARGVLKVDGKDVMDATGVWSVTAPK
ncbi:PaaI family thioesterase [Zhongshania sp.]|uniref:PaaI family thioesterase n=1 Tax=Zhongshania sp. TaxID=1971902 RepID=UPI00356804A1